MMALIIPVLRSIIFNGSMDTSTTNSNAGPDVIFSDGTNHITNEKETNTGKILILINGKYGTFLFIVLVPFLDTIIILSIIY